MTPAQAALKEYLLAKFQEGVFANTKSASAVLKKASAEFAADLPLAVSDMLAMFSDNVASVLGQEVLKHVAGVARDVSRRGVGVVFREYASKAKNVRDDLDLQYQRGVERNRKAGR
jgi:hypothetical protein